MIWARFEVRLTIDAPKPDVGEDLDEGTTGVLSWESTLIKGFWIMRGVPSQQSPSWNETLSLILGLIGNPLPTTE